MSKRSLGMAGIALALTWLVGGAAPQPVHAADSTAGWADQVLTLVNQERASAGLNPLRMSPELTLAAERYSKYMADANFFAHEGPDGSTPGSRQQAAGYQGAVVWGENIAAGQPDPQSVMTAWMNSTGHRANILFRGFTEIGIGIYSAPGTRYGVYWTQEFGARPQGAGAGTPSTTVPPPATTPSLTAITPDQGTVGDTVTLSGQRFGSAAGSVSFSGVAATLLSWSDNQIQVRVPAGASSGSVYVQASSGLSNGRGFTVLQTATPPPSAPPPSAPPPSAPPPSAPPPTPSASAPTIAYVYPTTVSPGSRVTLYGRGFGQTRGTVRLNDTPVTVSYWYDSIISVTIPNGATSGQLVVETAGGAANAGALTVINNTAPAPAPARAPTPNPGTGTGAGSGGTSPVPVGSPAPPTTTRPVITGGTYQQGSTGWTLTLYGSGFGSQPGHVLLGRAWLTAQSWSDTTLVLQLPYRVRGSLRLAVIRADGRPSIQMRARF